MCGVGLGEDTVRQDCDESRLQPDRLLIRPAGGWPGRRRHRSDISQREARGVRGQWALGVTSDTDDSLSSGLTTAAAYPHSGPTRTSGPHRLTGRAPSRAGSGPTIGAGPTARWVTGRRSAAFTTSVGSAASAPLRGRVRVQVVRRQADGDAQIALTMRALVMGAPGFEPVGIMRDAGADRACEARNPRGSPLRQGRRPVTACPRVEELTRELTRGRRAQCAHPTTMYRLRAAALGAICAVCTGLRACARARGGGPLRSVRSCRAREGGAAAGLNWQPALGGPLWRFVRAGVAQDLGPGPTG